MFRKKNKKNLTQTVQPADSAMPEYGEEIIAVIHSNMAPLLMKEKLEDYHEKDIAEVLECLSLQDRRKLYRILDADMLSEVLEYADEDDAGRYLNEIDIKKIPRIIENMETDSAVAVLRELDADKRAIIMELLDDKARANISLASSFTEDEVGSKMTANFIVIRSSCTIKQAMSSLIEQAARNDNIATLFVTDEDGVFMGAVDLKDLITARQDDSLDALVISSFPYVYALESLDDCLEELKDY